MMLKTLEKPHFKTGIINYTTKLFKNKMSIVLISLSVIMNEIQDKIDEIPANRKCPHHYSMRHQLLHSNNMVIIY